MSTALAKRVARLEQATPDGAASPVVIIYGEGYDAEADMTGVDGVALARLAGESVAAFSARLEVHFRAEGRRAMPVCFARYGDHDEPDAPTQNEPDGEGYCRDVLRQPGLDNEGHRA